MFLISSCRCLCPIHWSLVLSQEWRCSWSSTDSRCSNYSWMIINFIAYQGATYIRGLKVYFMIFLKTDVMPVLKMYPSIPLLWLYALWCSYLFYYMLLWYSNHWYCDLNSSRCLDSTCLCRGCPMPQLWICCTPAEPSLTASTGKW